MLSTEKKPTAVFNYLILIGIVLLIGGVSLFILTFFPIAKQEITYHLSAQKGSGVKLKPIDREFGIVIPKIKANSKVVANIDPFNEKVYQQALAKGVAQARGTVLPDQTGNTFIFAHSAGNWYIANEYNAVFYLLYKLVKGDLIEIYHQNKLFTYHVREVKYVDPTQVNYLSSKTDGWKTLTLMTCWPPATSLKRLIVIADLTP